MRLRVESNALFILIKIWKRVTNVKQTLKMRVNSFENLRAVPSRIRGQCIVYSHLWLVNKDNNSWAYSNLKRYFCARMNNKHSAAHDNTTGLLMSLDDVSLSFFFHSKNRLWFPCLNYFLIAMLLTWAKLPITTRVNRFYSFNTKTEFHSLNCRWMRNKEWT